MPAYRAFLTLGFLSALFVGIPDTMVAVYYVRIVGLGPLELVLLGTVVEVIGLLFEVPTGVVADLYSRRLSVLIGVFLVGVCFVVQGLMPVLPAIVFAETLRGLGRTFSSGALEAWIADEIGEAAAAAAYLRYAQLRQIGAIVGTVIGVTLASVALWIPVFVGGALMLGLGTFLALVMPERGFRRGHHHAELSPMRGALGTFANGLREIRGRPLLATLLALSLFLALSTEGLDRLWEAHFLRYFELPTIGGLDSVVWFGAINVAFMLLSVLANQIVRSRVDVTDDSTVGRVLIATSLVRIVGIVVFGLATSFGFAVAGYLTHMVFRSISGPLFTGWINRHVDSRVRATVLSMNGQVDAIGQLSGGPLIGAIAELATLRTAMVAVGATLLPAIPLLVRARKQSAGGVRETPVGASGG
jgi:DHA3 family tetracycline resistance protein-like MFS transporter